MQLIGKVKMEETKAKKNLKKIIDLEKLEINKINYSINNIKITYNASWKNKKTLF